MNLFFPLKTERVPVANQQCGLHSGLTVICLFIQDNKGSLWKIPLGGDLMHTANIVVMYHFQSISESDCRSDVPHAVGSNLKKNFLWIHFTLITNLDVLLLWTSFSPFFGSTASVNSWRDIICFNLAHKSNATSSEDNIYYCNHNEPLWITLGKNYQTFWQSPLGSVCEGSQVIQVIVV